MTTTAIGQLLVSQMHRDILKHLLRLAPISVFRTIGRINRHCRSMTSALSMFWPRPVWFTAWKPSMSWFNGPTRLAVSTAWIPFSQKFISAGLIPAWRPSLALLGSLFTDVAHRDVLSHLLRVASPAIFGAVAQLNRHCAEVARSLKSAKQERWLSPPVSADMPNRWFMHNGRLHGQQTRRYRAANANNHNYILILRCRYEHGLYEEWYNDGQPKLQRNYDAGQLHGPQIEYYVDGMVKSITNYRRVVV